MKKILLVGLLLLVAAGCNKTTDTNQNNQTATNQPEMQTYVNSTYGFEFTYPKSMQFVTPAYTNLQDKIVQIQTARDLYPNTNFGDAAFSVSAEYAKDLNSCLSLAQMKSSEFKNKVNINGTEFYLAQNIGAAAGNRYDTSIYRALVGDKLCIELNQTMHTMNIGNYPEGAVTEVDKTAVQKELDKVRESFRFKK